VAKHESVRQNNWGKTVEDVSLFVINWKLAGDLVMMLTPFRNFYIVMTISCVDDILQKIPASIFRVKVITEHRSEQNFLCLSYIPFVHTCPASLMLELITLTVYMGARRDAVGWGTALQVRRSRVRFPMSLWRWGVKAAGALGWQPYHLHAPTVLKSGSLLLFLLEPSEPAQACTGVALP